MVVAGPNGAGKSTCAPELLRDELQVRTYVNADEIARGLAGFDPEGVAVAAGRVLLTQVARLTRLRRDFAIESTLAGRGHARWLRAARRQGFDVHILFLALASPDLAIRRVAKRVETGGHDIPPEVIRRRFDRGLRNLFTLYVPLATSWRLYDNTSGASPRLVVVGGSDGARIVTDPVLWTHYQEQTAR